MMRDLIIYLIGINVVTFFIYGIDKWKARRGKWRIPEDTLIWLAIAGGSIGALLGMYLFRHKTQHKKFTLGIPAAGCHDMDRPLRLPGHEALS